MTGHRWGKWDGATGKCSGWGTCIYMSAAWQHAGAQGVEEEMDASGVVNNVCQDRMDGDWEVEEDEKQVVVIRYLTEHDVGVDCDLRRLSSIPHSLQ